MKPPVNDLKDRLIYELGVIMHDHRELIEKALTTAFERGCAATLQEIQRRQSIS